MKNDTLYYKGFVGAVEFDDEAGVFGGRVINLQRAGINFEGETVAELRQAFIDSVDDYLDWCKEEGIEPEKPFSGKFIVRVEPDLHRKMAQCATTAQQSLNAWTKAQLERAVTDNGTEVRPRAKARKGKR